MNGLEKALRAGLPLVLAAVLPFSLCAPAGGAPLLGEVPFPVAARAAILIDAGSGQTLMALNPDEALPLASVTKVMTFRLVFRALANGAIRLEQEVEVGGEVEGLPQAASRMDLGRGDHVTVTDLLSGAAVGSANDACLVLAGLLGGSTTGFVALMNREAGLLGLGSAHFEDPHGLSPGNVMSARDTATLARRHLEDAGALQAYHATREFTYRGRTLKSHNQLLGRYPGADGLKTGHIEEAGFNVVGTAERDGLRLIVVLLGSPAEVPSGAEAGAGAAGQTPDDRAEAFRDGTAAAILDWGFANYGACDLAGQGAEVARLPVFKGRGGRVGLGPAAPVSVAVPKGRESEITVSLDLASTYLVAPVASGQRVGFLVVSLGPSELLRAPLVTLATVERGSLLEILWGGLRLAWAHMFAPLAPEPTLPHFR